MNLHFNTTTLAAVHGKGMGAEQEVSQETVAVIQAKEVSGSDQGDENR